MSIFICDGQKDFENVLVTNGIFMKVNMEYNNNDNNNNSNNKNKTEFSAHEFVKRLLTEGENETCDDSNKEFDRNKLPEFYDEELFQKGRVFFYDHCFALFYNMMLGLLAILAIPSVRRVLVHTQMSGTKITAYRRYLATLLHVKVWYDADLKPGSKLWKSINNIKRMHNSASKSGSRVGLGRIAQKDMALTQLSFMGFAICRSKFLGIHEASEEEIKAFIHVWRVFGYLMGIDDRFNICRESVMETQEICNILLTKVFHPEIRKKDEEFLSMSYYFLKGIWVVAPYFQFKSILCILDNITRSSYQNMAKPVYYELNWFQRCHYWLLVNFGKVLQYDWIRISNNYHFLFSVFLMKWFPFIGYFYYGVKRATVDIGV